MAPQERLGELVRDGVAAAGGAAGDAATPGTTLRLAYRDSGVAVAVDDWKVGIADSVGLALRGPFLDRDGFAPTLWASVAARCRRMTASRPPPLPRLSLSRRRPRRGGAGTPAPSGVSQPAGRGAGGR